MNPNHRTDYPTYRTDTANKLNLRTDYLNQFPRLAKGKSIDADGEAKSTARLLNRQVKCWQRVGCGRELR